MSALSPCEKLNEAYRRKGTVHVQRVAYDGKSIFVSLRDAIALMAPDLNQAVSRRYLTREQKNSVRSSKNQ